MIRTASRSSVLVRFLAATLLTAVSFSTLFTSAGAESLTARVGNANPSMASDRDLAAINTPLSGTESIVFSVYPGGGNGELGYVEPPSPEVVIDRLNQLRGDQMLDVHLYTAWSWYNEPALDAEVKRYTDAGFLVTLTVKYSPPAGHEGDVEGFASFVRHVVSRYGTNPSVHKVVIGNEINVVNGNPGSSDGPFAAVREATVQGIIVARDQLDEMGANARIGFNMAVLGREADARFVSELAQLGGPEFMAAVSFLGLNVYPGLWPVGTGDAYQDMVNHIRNARYSLTAAGFGQDVTIEILENGYPTADQSEQLAKLNAFVRAVCDTHKSAGVSGYSWFDLWDANSNSDSMYAHYGLLRSDMTTKPSFERYQEIVANGCAAVGNAS